MKPCKSYCSGSCCGFSTPALECGGCNTTVTCNPSAACYIALPSPVPPVPPMPSPPPPGHPDALLLTYGATKAKRTRRRARRNHTTAARAYSPLKWPGSCTSVAEELDGWACRAESKSGRWAVSSLRHCLTSCVACSRCAFVTYHHQNGRCVWTGRCARRPPPNGLHDGDEQTCATSYCAACVRPV